MCGKCVPKFQIASLEKIMYKNTILNCYTNDLNFFYSALFMVDTSSLVPIISLNNVKMNYTKGIMSVIQCNIDV